jgi:hypothetical protein
MEMLVSTINIINQRLERIDVVVCEKKEQTVTAEVDIQGDEVLEQKQEQIQD